MCVLCCVVAWDVLLCTGIGDVLMCRGLCLRLPLVRCVCGVIGVRVPRWCFVGGWLFCLLC